GGNGDSTTFSGSISGTNVIFEKRGSGTLTLPRTLSFNGLSSVVGGTLLVNGSLASPLSVISPGALGGTGTLASVTAHGPVRPGVAGPGRLAISGGLTNNSSGSLEFELDGAIPGVSYDQIRAGGPIDLGSA